MAITAADITAAIAKRHFPYALTDGSTVSACAVSEVADALRDNGWRRVGRFDRFDIRDLGLKVVSAQYVGGVRPTGRFIDVVVYDAA